LTYFLTTLGLIPYFTSRAFVPLFASALVARFGAEWGLLANFAGVHLLDSVPAWVTSNAVLLVLGVLASVEVAGHKSPELRELLSLTDTQVKGLAAFVLCLVLAASTDAGVEMAAQVRQAGFPDSLSFTHFWALLVGAATWFLARLRKAIFLFLVEVDEDDDLGLQKLLSWVEDGLGFLGVLFVVILPVLALVVAGLTLLTLYLVQKYLERQEEKRKIPCDDCSTPNPPCGIHCAACGKPRSQPTQVGLLGTIKETLVTDLDAHRLQLVAQKRCRRCGERLRGKRLDQSCQACGTAPFESAGDLEGYIRRLQAGLPRTLLILLLLGAVPVAGLVAGVLYYRLTLISSLRHYIPRSSRFLGRWTVRIVNLFLICLQPVPLLGALTLPAMCLTNFLVYRSLLRRQGRLFPLAEPLPAGA
jgi:hypothetical protein